MTQPLLTLAVIVRDQAPLLAALLDHHRDLYDEAVVVDTGSRDDSVAVGRRGGARIISSQWRDDFSHARNRALEASRGDWILVLDCDEAIAPADQARLRTRIDQARPCLMILDQRNYTDQSQALGFIPAAGDDVSLTAGAPGYIVRRQIRVFPSGHGLAYAGAIHESLELSAATKNLPKECVDAAVHHYGHVQGPEGHRRRGWRNGRILRREIRRRPFDPVLLTEFATQLIFEGRGEEAGRVCRHALKVAPGHGEIYRTRLILGRLVLDHDPHEALALGERALQERPDLAECWAEGIRLNLVTGRRRRAQLLCREGRRIFPLDGTLARLETQVSAPADDNLMAENG